MRVEKKLELIHMQITRNCNLRCWFCGQWGNKGFFSDSSGRAMEFDDWKKVIDSVACRYKSQDRYPSVMLWGGEPLVSPIFEKISSYLSDLGFELGVVTNGVLMDKWADILKSKFKRIYISVDGTREIHDGIRGKGVFDKVISNAELIKNGNAELIIMSVLSPRLLPTLHTFPKCLEKLEPKELLLQDMIYLSCEEVASYHKWLKACFGYEAREINSWQTDMPEDYSIKKAEALKRVEAERFSFPVRHLAHGSDALNEHCLSPFRHIHVTWNGNVMYCTDFYDFYAGNVTKDDVMDIFDNQFSEKFRNEILKGRCPSCNHCSWRNNLTFRF